MSATLAEKVMGRLAGRAVRAGEMVEIGPDWTFALDDGIGLIDQNFRRYGVDRLARPEKIALFFDHYAPADTPLHAHVQRVGRKLFEQFKLPRERLFDVGEGISHQIAVESGMVLPGQMVTNMDSHTITIGAVGALGCGIGGAEMAYLWAHGKLWFRVPESIRIELDGALPPGTAAKDIVLAILRKISARGAIYASIEYHGAALARMGNPGADDPVQHGHRDGRQVRRGARRWRHPSAISKALASTPGEMPVPDAAAAYSARHRIDLGALVPLLSAPNKVDNVHPVADFSHVRIHQAFLGTCTNGRLEDFAIAAAILQRQAHRPRRAHDRDARVAQGLFPGARGGRDRDAGRCRRHRHDAGLRCLCGHAPGRAGRRGGLHRVVEPQLPGPDGAS